MSPMNIVEKPIAMIEGRRISTGDGIHLIAKHCADGLKKVTLELGGNCPVLVFDDADLNQAADRTSRASPPSCPSPSLVLP